MLGKAKVYNLEMSLSVQKDVLQLDIPVDDAEGVQVSQGTDSLCGLEQG